MQRIVGWACYPFTNQYRREQYICAGRYVILSQYDIKIREMKINSHIIPLEGREGLWLVDNMVTVAILTLGEMVGGDGRYNSFHLYS